MEIEFIETFHNSDGSTLNFTFRGQMLENVNEKQIRLLLDNIFKVKNRNLDILRVATYIRTIFKDIEETYLYINLKNPNDENSVVYQEKELIAYFDKETNELDAEYFEFSYTKSAGIHFSSNFNSRIKEYSTSQSVSNLITQLLGRINKLNDATPINLDLNDEKLCHIYRLFYSENPNFSLQKTHLRLQSMMNLLIIFGIYPDGDYYFRKYPDNEMPLSLGLDVVINKLAPLGEINDNVISVQFPEKKEKQMKIVGEIVRNHLYKFESDEIDYNLLKQISSIVYTKEYLVSKSESTKRIAGHCECSIEDVKKSSQLVKKVIRELSEEEI